MYLLFVILAFHVTWSSVIDDLQNVAVFPPPVHDIEGQPRGHLKQFGAQRPPEGPIKEYTEALSAKEFWDLHAKDKIPLVLRGYLKSSPAVQKWNDKYLAKKYGDLDVLVEHKSEDRTSSSGRMVLSDFLKHYNDSDMYIVSMFPLEMMSEVRAIPSILCGTFRNYTHESNFWMSAGGTRSVIHYDADHNFHCMLSGRKDFMMINNNITTKTNLYYKKKNPNSGSGFSFLDPDSINMHKFKRIADVPWTYATLYPGDCIFIPSQYIHQVRGYGRTIATTTLFTADVADNFNGDDCTDDIMTKYHSMAEIPFQWTYKKGDSTIDMGYMNVQLVIERFREMLQDPAVDGKISKKIYLILSGRIGTLGRNKTKMGKVWNEVFGFSDDYIFTANDIDSITLEQWKIFCRAIESAHGVVTNGSEPVFVKPGERHKWEEEHPEEDDGNYLSEREKQLHKASGHDPMLDHLTKEEKREYLKQIKEKKLKYGQDIEFDDVVYDDDDDNDDDHEEEEELGTSNWVSEVTWSLEEVPDQYRREMENGKIPLDFKDDFMNSLSDVIKERFKDEFEKNIMPNELLRELSGNVANVEGSSKLPYNIIDVGITKQRQLVQGKVPAEDIPLFTKNFPEHKEDLEKGILPTILLQMFIGSDNEDDFKEDIEAIKEELFNERDEL